MDAEDAVTSLYGQLIDGWNAGDADAMAVPLARDGLVVGFDGSSGASSPTIRQPHT
jgi:uncharacterized protein (TIGR02246 family)